MTAAQEHFSSQAPPLLLAEMRHIAWREGSNFQSVLEEAMRSYVESKARQGVRPEVMAHFQNSIERNWKLMKLLADT